MQNTLYHKSLRVSALLFALLLLFESGLLFNGADELTDSTILYVANVVGITASVAPTELNEITAELTKRETELDAREREINARALDTANTSKTTDYSTYILSAILFVMLLLIVFNYALDFMRERRQMFTHANTT